MAESVVVGVRVRPFNEREKNLNARLCIEMNGPTTIIRDLSKDEEVVKDFTFDESFWSHDGFEDDGTGYMKALPGTNYADQRRVYDVFGARVLQNAWEGFHCCLFAYGQTGAGKSYSMVGYGKNQGIVPISCEEIFKRITGTKDTNKRFEVTVSMVEIYNEAVQDLLILPEDRPKKGLEIRESKLLGIYIDGVTKRPVDSYAAIEETIEEATNHRTIGSTLMNATSSRAHTVQAIEFKQIDNVGGSDQVKVSMINLVDLAGSEKAGQTGASGDRLKEGAAINKSLSALGNVIEKLAEKSAGKKNIIIPYRDSKLTRLLQNALGGSSKTIMICALSPASSNYEETLSTLRYADRAKKIKNTAVVNENPQEKLLRELRDENAKLKELMQQMQNGEVPDMQVMKEMQEKQQEMADAQAALDEMAKSFEQRLAEAKTVHDKTVEREKNKRRASMSRSVIGTAASNTPMLVNLNADPQLTCRIRYSLDEGKFLRVGTFQRDDDDKPSDSEDEESDEEDEEPEIMLHHSSVFHKHAKLQNVDGAVRIYSEGDAAEHTFVNGQTVSERMAKQKDEKANRRGSLMGIFFGATATPEDIVPEDPDSDSGVLLSHGDRIVFGECCFFFCDPAQGLPEVMVATKEVDYAKAVSELSKVSSKWLTAGNKIRALHMLGVTGLKDQVEELEEQVRVLKEDGARQQEEISQRDALIESAVEQAEEVAKTNAEISQSSVEKDEEIARLAAEVESLTAAKAEMEKLMEEAASRLADLETARDEATKANEEKDSTIEKLREEFKSLQESQASTSKLEQQMQEEQDNAKANISKLEEQVQEEQKNAKASISKLEERLQEEQQNAKASISKLEDQLQEEQQNAKAKILKLEEQLQEQQNAKADADKLSTVELQRVSDEAASKIEELEASKRELEKINTDLETSRRDIEKASVDKDASIARLEEEVRGLQTATTEKTESNDHVEEAARKDGEIASLTREMVELKRLNEELLLKSSKDNDLREDSEKKDKIIEQLQATNATLQDVIKAKDQGIGRPSDPEIVGGEVIEKQKSLAESITVSFQEAVKALDLVESSLTDLVSRRDQNRKAAEYPMF